MKKLKFLLLASFALFSTTLSGDIIIVGPPPAKINVRIQNLNEFPEVAVIGLSDCMAFSNSNKAYRIEADSCLQVEKACPLSLYAMKTDYFKQTDLDKIDLNKDKNVQKLNLTVKAKSFNTNDYRSVEIDFNLARHKNNAYYLYKTKMTCKYRDNRPDLVQTFKDDVVDPFKPIAVSTKNASGQQL